MNKGRARLHTGVNNFSPCSFQELPATSQRIWNNQNIGLHHWRVCINQADQGSGAATNMRRQR